MAAERSTLFCLPPNRCKPSATLLAGRRGSDEKLAQTFVAAKTGCLTHVTVPIACDSSATLAAPAEPPGGFRIIEFTRAAGHAYFDARPNPPGWLRMLPPDRDDLPFQTFVEAGTRDKCKKCK